MTEMAGLLEAAGVIRRAEGLALSCHVGPDGDALGSMLAVAAAARSAGKEVWPSFGEPFVVPETYRFLPIDLLVPPGAVPERPEVMVAFDAGSLDRLGVLAPKAAAAGSLVVVDHHVSNEGFGTINLVVGDASSSAELAYHLLLAAGWDITPQVALCLLTGIVTDTGRFQYSNARADTLRVAATLVEKGAQPEVIGQHVYEETPFGYLSVVSAVLGRAVLEPERHFVWSVLYEDDLVRGGVTAEDTDPLIDALRVPRESDVALLLKQLSGGRVKVSLRSRGRIDVGAIAVSLGGGGHHNAAGATLESTCEDVLSRIRELLPVD